MDFETRNDLRAFKGLTHWCLNKNDRRFADDIFKCIFVKTKFDPNIQSPMKFVPMDPVD